VVLHTQYPARVTIIMSSFRTVRCGADLSVFGPSHPMSMRMQFANWFQVVR
jgi:hypothetical protein